MKRHTISTLIATISLLLSMVYYAISSAEKTAVNASNIDILFTVVKEMKIDMDSQNKQQDQNWVRFQDQMIGRMDRIEQKIDKWGSNQANQEMN